MWHDSFTVFAFHDSNESCFDLCMHDAHDSHQWGRNSTTKQKKDMQRTENLKTVRKHIYVNAI